MKKIILVLVILFVTISCKEKKTLKIKETNIVFSNDTITYNESTTSNDTISDRFDKTEQILLERVDSDEIWIYNCLNSGFTQSIKLFKVRKNLEIKFADYDYWTDHLDLETRSFYKVEKSEINFDKNPFKTKEPVNIECKLVVNEFSYNSKKIIKSEVFLDKIISIEMNDEDARNFKEKYGIVNSFNAYPLKFIDTKPKLRTNLKDFKIAIKNEIENGNIMIMFSIDENGNVLKSSLKFNVSKSLNRKQKNKVRKLIENIKYTKAYISNKNVRAQLLLRFKI